MKNLIAFALAGLLTVSTAASVPPAISESLLTVSSSEVSFSDSALPESASVSEQAKTDPEDAPEATSSSAPEQTTQADSQTATESPLPPYSGSGEPAGEGTPESMPLEQTKAPEDGKSEAPADNAADDVISDSSEVQEAKSAEVEKAEEQPEETIARFEEALCQNLADEQAGSLMGHYGLDRSPACSTGVVSLTIVEYETSDNLDRNYAMLWAALQNAVSALAAEGHTTANCTYEDGTLTLWV